ncbi:MAG: serine/threonine protein kinase [Proteobacteria bacterium]|nr:serine/threonine protein kinase [Pseudomonadota bacterium]
MSELTAAGSPNDQAPPSCPQCASERVEGVAFCRGCGAHIADDPLLGAQIDQRYEVLRRLGSGGMGTVYEVQHLRLKKRFALKVVRRDLGDLKGFAARFEREALATSRQEHPNCVLVTDFGHAATGELYLVMELLAGRSLTSLLNQPVAVSLALDLVRQVLLALQHAHGTGLVHRDIKADNVMLIDGPEGSTLVKVLDFGLAVPPAARGAPRPAAPAEVAGTPTYMAPEQAAGLAIDERSDLYAVGVILFYLLTGRPPFRADDPMRVLRQKTTHRAPALDEVAPGVFSRALQQLVARALAREPEQRFPSAEAMLRALDQVQRARGGGLSTASRWRSLRAIQRGGCALARAFHRWYRCSELEAAPRWSLRLRLLVRPGHGRVVLASALVGLLALSALALAGLWWWRASRIAASGVVAGGASSAATAPPMPDELAQRLATARLLIARGACREAALDLRNAVAERPTLAPLHYLFGAAKICQGEVGAALAAYRRAIHLDARYRRDARLLEDAGALLATPGARAQALAFLVEELGPGGVEPLLGAVTSNDASWRHRALGAVLRLGASRRVDWLTVWRLDLNQRTSCALQGRAVAGLRHLDDPRALRVLLDAQSPRARRRNRPRCPEVDRELAAAIAARQGLPARQGGETVAMPKGSASSSQPR